MTSRVRVTLRKCTDWPQNELEHYGVKGTPSLHVMLVLPSPGFCPCFSMASRFRVTHHFETNALNNSKWSSTQKGHRYQIPIHVALRSAVLELQTICRQLHRITMYLKMTTLMTKWSKHTHIRSEYHGPFVHHRGASSKPSTHTKLPTVQGHSGWRLQYYWTGCQES